MVTRHTHKSITWIDLENPSAEEVRSLMEEFEFAPSFAEELLTPSLRPKVEVSDEFLYLVLHFPVLRHTNTTSNDQEIDFIIGKKVIITTRYESIDSLHAFSKVFEVNSILGKSSIGESTGMVLYYMLMRAYKMLQHELEYVRDRLEDAEKSVFDGKEREMVAVLSSIGRDLLNVRQALAEHKEVLLSLLDPALVLFGDTYRVQHHSLMGAYSFIQSMHSNNIHTLNELRETNTALLYTKQNEIMKTLTIMAFVTFPLSLIAGIFGMNTQTMPVVGRVNDFWIIVCVMLLATGVMFWYFKRNHWL